MFSVTVLAACLNFLSFFSLFLWDFHPLLINYLCQHSSPVGSQIQHQLSCPLQHSEEPLHFVFFAGPCCQWPLFNSLLNALGQFSICFLHLPLAQVWFFPPRTAAQVHLSWFLIKHCGVVFTSTKHHWQAQALLSCSRALQNRAKQPHSPQLSTGKHRKLQTSAMPWVQAVHSQLFTCVCEHKDFLSPHSEPGMLLPLLIPQIPGQGAHLLSALARGGVPAGERTGAALKCLTSILVHWGISPKDTSETPAIYSFHDP